VDLLSLDPKYTQRPRHIGFGGKPVFHVLGGRELQETLRLLPDFSQTFRNIRFTAGFFSKFKPAPIG
jgi:hypothetical protein